MPFGDSLGRPRGAFSRASTKGRALPPHPGPPPRGAGGPASARIGRVIAGFAGRVSSIGLGSKSAARARALAGAPDFVLVQRGVREAFAATLQKWLRAFYGEDVRSSPDYGRIVNARHFERLVTYLRDGKVVHGGTHDAKDLFLAPTILEDVSPDAPVMQEEIFGPILPVLEFAQLGDALASLRGRPTPLALYLFSHDRATQARVLAETRSGGACLNDVVSHMIGTGLPFGGLGESGLGAYHGRAGFDAFSHQRAVLRSATWLDTPFRYPPQKLSLAGLKRGLRFLLSP